LKILFFILVCVISLVVYQIILISIYGSKTSYSNTPFVRTVANPRLHFLFLGDSTAVGTGTKDGTGSVAGWFAKDFPEAQIENYGVNGNRLAGLLKNFYPGQRKNFDLVVIQIGANDIIHWTPYSTIEENMTKVATKARELSRNVIILHSGRVGLAPIFSWPLSEILTYRATHVRDLYIRVAKQTGVHYVDLFIDRDKDPFLKDISKYYSPDHFHPSADGYHWWYERIRETMKKQHIDL
jgi:lysophospholipase L1-like esterase